jgi:hypothetical protein
VKDSKAPRNHFEHEWLIEPAVIAKEFGDILESWQNQLTALELEEEEDFL